MNKSTTYLSDEMPDRAAGVVEHFHRATWYLANEPSLTEPAMRFRVALAACYSARAIVELMLEAAEHDEIEGLEGESAKERRVAMEAQVSSVSCYALLERIRIHDFHRCGMRWESITKPLWVSGPIRFRTGKGTAAVTISDDGIIGATQGAATIKMQRPLQASNGLFHDAETGIWLSVQDAVKHFLADLRPHIDRFVIATVEREANRVSRRRRTP